MAEKKELLLIGKLSAQTQATHTLLSKYFHVQLCSDSPDIVKTILKMCQPACIVINLQDMTKLHSLIFFELRRNYSNIPVFCFGSERELEEMDDNINNIQVQQLRTPLNEVELLEGICHRLKLDTSILSDLESEADGLFKKQKLLFVDDDPILLRSMKRLLQGKYDVVIASSGAEGIAIIARELPDLIFLDYDMPICDGKQTLQMIRNLEGAENIPVVFLTGISDKEHIEQVLSFRPAGYLLKPADTARLLQVIKNTIGEPALSY